MESIYRIVVCADIEAESLTAAYSRLFEVMAGVTRVNEDIDWESSDESFDLDGNQIDSEELQRARLEHFERLENAE